MPSENLSDGIFYQSSHIFYQGCKIYPKQQKPPCRHSRKSGNLNPTRQKFIRSDNNLFIVIPAQAGI
nr:hypothetical protein [Neisseria meningitidis]